MLLSLQLTSSCKINGLWPALVTVHGKPRHLQGEESVERPNGDINLKDMLVA